jgi:hypothetical protein
VKEEEMKEGEEMKRRRAEGAVLSALSAQASYTRVA